MRKGAFTSEKTRRTGESIRKTIKEILPPTEGRIFAKLMNRATEKQYMKLYENYVVAGVLLVECKRKFGRCRYKTSVRPLFGERRYFCRIFVVI